MPGAAGEKALAGLGRHHRIDHRRKVRRRVEQTGDELDDLDAAQHPGLDGVGADVVQDGPGLGFDDARRNPVDVMDAQGVLGRDRGDCAGRIAAQSGHCLDVRLDSGPSTGVGTGDDQDAAPILGLLGVSHGLSRA